PAQAVMRRWVLIDEAAGGVEVALVVEHDPLAAGGRLPLPGGKLDVGEPGERPEVSFRVVVRRILLAEPRIRRVWILVELERVVRYWLVNVRDRRTHFAGSSLVD